MRKINLLTFLLFIASFIACKKEETKSNDITLKSIILTINNIDYTFTNTADTFKIALPAGSIVNSATIKEIEIAQGATSSSVIGESILFTNGIAKITITAENNITKKEYVFKIDNELYNTTKINSIEFTISGINYSATIINDSIEVNKFFDGNSISEVKIKDFSLADYASISPKKNETLSIVNNLGIIVITAQDGITKKNYTVKINALPITKTYSGGNYLGMGLTDVLFLDTDTVLTINNLANNEYEFSFGIKTGKKTAIDNKLIFKKSDLGTPSDDGITFNLKTNGTDVVVATYKMYEIRHWRDLQAIRLNTSGNFSLMNDIVLPEFGERGLPSTGFEPIGTDIMQFTGKLNGNGKIIKDLAISKLNRKYSGLFSYLGSGSSVSNLGIMVKYSNLIPFLGDAYFGVLAGYNEGTIENCFTEQGDVYLSIFGTSYVGSLVGYNKNIIKNCYSSVGIDGIHYVGGLVGANAGSIINCYATGSVNASDNGGGLVGNNSGSIINSAAFGIRVSRTSGSLDNTFGRITGNNSNTLNNNKANSNMFVINELRNSSTGNSIDGADINLNSISQTDFENLGWNFTTVWKWDATAKLPKLR